MAKNRDFKNSRQLGETDKMVIEMDIDGTTIKTIKDIGPIDINELDKMVEVVEANSLDSFPKIKNNIKKVGDQSITIQEEIDKVKDKNKD